MTGAGASQLLLIMVDQLAAQWLPAYHLQRVARLDAL